ncbi:2-keto-3-deoxygluconate permease [Synergistes jonesii]|uniref:2-keto-3-deoxygluconate permease n=1 Tax=Synergistes jonesii TaxID=2754 RepID=UPI00248E4B53|nr:2-keto-3-deoxygluconate permease [Synergistes jonesii]
MDILGKVNKVPGGIMVVPMIITAVINTFIPAVLKIGGPTSGAFSGAGAMATIGMLLFTAGSQTKYSDLGSVCARGGLLVIVRLAVAFTGAWLTLKLFGPEGIWGASALAITISLASCNPGVYAGLMQSYGDTVDKSAMGILNLIAVPATPLVILGVADGTGFDYMSAVSSLVPFALGMVLANADEKVRKLFSTATPVILFFLGCCLGASINLKALSQAGVANIVLIGLIVCIFLPIMIAADKLILRRPGYAAVAATCLGGLSVVAPRIIGERLPQYQPYVESATAQLAVTLVICIFIFPYITKFIVGKFGSGVAPRAEQ